MTLIGRAPPRLRTVLVFFVVLLGAVQVLVIALSLGSIRLTQRAALLILMVASVLAFLSSRSLGQGPGDVVSQEGSPVFSPRFRRFLLIVTLTIFCVFAVLGYLTEDFSYDGNAYHIPTINQWAIKGFVHDVDASFDNSQDMNGYPKGAEAVTFVIVKALGGKLLNALNLFYAPLGFFGIALLCHLFGASVRDSLVFGMFYFLIPANLSQYSSTYVDAAFGSAVIALLALLGSNLVNRQNRLAEAFPIGCAIGTVIAIKGSGLLIAAVSVVAFLAWGLKAGPSSLKRLPAVLLLIGLSLVVATAVGGFWYVKNYVHHGSPLYPIGLSLAGHTVWPGETTANALSESRNTPLEIRALHPVWRVVLSWVTPLRTLPWSRSLPRSSFSETDTHLGALGALWILGCVPAVLACPYLLKRGAVEDPLRRVMYYFLATSVLLGFLATPMNWWARYTVWVFAFGLPSMWLVLSVARDSGSRLRRFVQSWVTVCTFLLIFRTAIIMLIACLRPVGEIKREEHHMATLVFRTESSLLPLFPEMRSKLLADVLRTETAVGVGPRELGFVAETIYGQLSSPIGFRNLIPVPAEATEADVRRLHSEGHLNYILWLTVSPIPSVLVAHFRTRGSEGPFTYLELIEDSFL